MKRVYSNSAGKGRSPQVDTFPGRPRRKRKAPGAVATRPGVTAGKNEAVQYIYSIPLFPVNVKKKQRPSKAACGLVIES